MFLIHLIKFFKNIKSPSVHKSNENNHSSKECGMKAGLEFDPQQLVTCDMDHTYKPHTL